MKKRYAIALILFVLYIIIAQIIGFGLLHRCDNYAGEYTLPIPTECRVYDNNGFILLALVPILLIGLYAKYGWPKDEK